VKEEIHTLYKELEYKYRREHGEEIDKHWDFYTALFVRSSVTMIFCVKNWD